MKRKSFISLAAWLLIAALGLTGCSRTVDDVEKWKAKGNISKLIKALEDPKVEVRLAATKALGELQAEEAIHPIAARYIDPEEPVILASVDALASIGTQGTITPLVAALRLGQPEARLIAAVKLGELKATGAVDTLCETLDDEEANIQLASAVSLGQIGEESASEALVAKLGADSAELRAACAVALGETGGDAAVTGLIPAMADSNGEVADAARDSLVKIGEPSIKPSLAALRDVEQPVRAGAIFILRKLEATPKAGADFIWYLLARVSVDTSDGIDKNAVLTLSKQGKGSIDTLLEAAAHRVPDFREHSTLALEAIGKPAVEKAVAAAGGDWFENREGWSGAPSWRLDLWAATAALNPDFELDSAKTASLEMMARPAFNIVVSPDFKPTRAYVPYLIKLLGDTTKPPPAQPDYDADGVPIIKEKHDMFRGEANQMMAKDKLAAADHLSTFPLIAAIEDENELIAGHAASILGERDEKRALEPLMKVTRAKVEAGEHLSNSPFYVALQRMDDPKAEPLIRKIRPNPDRAMRLFERKYGIHPISSETDDPQTASKEPITFRLGYIDRGKVGEKFVTFSRDITGDWKPNPPLTGSLP